MDAEGQTEQQATQLYDMTVTVMPRQLAIMLPALDRITRLLQLLP